MIIQPSTTTDDNPPLPVEVTSTDAWFAISGLVVVSTVCLIANAGRILNLVFPAGTFLVGLFLYRKYPVMYISYVWWIYFLTPCVRRLADWRGTWTDPSPILLAPIFVSLVAVETLVKYFPKVYDRKGLPFTLCFISIIYSFLIGLSNQNPLTGTILGFLGWFNPILLGFYFFIHWRSYPRYRQMMQRTFFWAVLIIGLYGIFQYFSPSEWDKTWLNNAINEKGIVSFGKPEPQEIRVFSTMNAPQVLAGSLMPGLILLFSVQNNPLRFPALGIGSLCFLLSSARAAWLSWLVGLISYIPLMKSRLQIRLIISLMIASIFVIPLVTMDPFSTMISARLGTFSDVSNDTSYNDRLSAYTSLFDQALFELLGKGMGLDESFGGADNGLLTMMFSLGWLGVIPYVTGLVLLFWKLFNSPYIRQDAFASASLAIAVGTFEQIISNVATTGVLGTVLWSFIGMAMAAIQYYKAQDLNTS